MNNLWKHVKTDGVYAVISDKARMESDLSPAVVYISVDTGHIWIRPPHEFFDGRFKKIEVYA